MKIKIEYFRIKKNNKYSSTKMVNNTLLEKLNKLATNARPMKKWSNRFGVELQSGRYIKKLTSNVKNLLKLVSGDDVVNMLKTILTIKQREQLAPIKYREALQNLVCYDRFYKC
jgi:hypothetical protein